MEDRYFKKLAKEQTKVHANLVVEESEDAEEFPTGLEEKALSVTVTDLSLHDEIDDVYVF